MLTLAEDSQRSTDDYLAVFAALSAPLRVRIVHMLIHQPDGEIACATLGEKLPVGGSTVSYHVNILRRAGLIKVRKAGRRYFYGLCEDNLRVCAPEFLAHLRQTEHLDASAA